MLVLNTHFLVLLFTIFPGMDASGLIDLVALLELMIFNDVLTKVDL